MHCPVCGGTLFSVLMEFSETNNNQHQHLTGDDYVTCRSCDREFLMGELVVEEEDDA